MKVLDKLEELGARIMEVSAASFQTCPGLRTMSYLPLKPARNLARFGRGKIRISRFRVRGFRVHDGNV